MHAPPAPSPFVAAALRDPGVMTDRFLEEWTAALPPDVAATLARWRPGDDLEEAMREFFERANEGELSREQKRGYEYLLGTMEMAALLRTAAARRAGADDPGPVLEPAKGPRVAPTAAAITPADAA